MQWGAGARWRLTGPTLDLPVGGHKFRFPAGFALTIAIGMLAFSSAAVGLSCGDSPPPVAARAGEVVISQPYALNSPLSQSLPVYLTILNQGDEDDVLVAASTKTAGEVVLVEEGEQSALLPEAPLEVPDRTQGGVVEVPAHSRIKLMPDGHHLLLLDALPRLSDGDVFTMELTFAAAGVVEVPVPVVTPRD